MARASRWWPGVVCVLVMGALATAAPGAPRAADLVKPQLLADVGAVQAGKPFRVGVLLRIAPGWHVYWKNPGDAGQAVKVTWEVPAGFKVSEVGYPVPTKFLQPGDLVAYGYQDEVMLVVTLTPPGELSSGEVPIRARVKYLVCEQVCLPGKAELSLSLPVGGEAKGANQEAFEEWGRQIPESGEAAAGVAEVKTSGGLMGGKSGKYTVDVKWKRPAENVEFFPGASSALNIHDITVKNKGKQQTRVTFVADLLAGQRPDVKALDSVVVYTDERGVRRGIDVAVPVNAEKGK